MAINRLQQYFTNSATLTNVLQLALNSRLIGLPLIEEELPALRKHAAELEAVSNVFQPRYVQPPPRRMAN